VHALAADDSMLSFADRFERFEESQRAISSLAVQRSATVPRLVSFAPVLLAFAPPLGACTKHPPGPSRAPDSSALVVATSHDERAAGGADASHSQGQGGGGITPGIRWVGRVDASNPSAIRFAWSGTGLVATVSGSKISVRLQTEGPTESVFFQPVIDGTAGPRFQVATGAAQTVTLGAGLTAGPHTVELYRDSEGMFGDSIFSGFVDGSVLGAPPATGRLIEIIGDSISAGYGNLGSEVHPPWDNTCSFSLDTESAYQAYGSILGRALNAEVSIIARSGWGVYRDGSSDTANVLSSVYANVLGAQGTPQWDFKRRADAVIINLGTNDSAQGDPGLPYEKAYVALIRSVRGHYPNAWIFLTIGPMTADPVLAQMRTHLSHVVASVADPKVTTVDIAAQDATATGCDYHPNVAENNAMAGVLTSVMKSRLGW
jgi:lysophospholipase L1-like esterase